MVIKSGFLPLCLNWKIHVWNLPLRNKKYNRADSKVSRLSWYVGLNYTSCSTTR